MNMLKRIAAATLVVAGLTLHPAVSVKAEVLLDMSKPLDLYGNNTKLLPVVTVNMSENIAVNTGVNRTDKTQDTTSVKAGTGLLSFLPAVGHDSGYTNTDTKTIQQSQTVAATMTVRVISVEPNGNLVLEGSKIMHASDRNIKMYLRAVARPQDILADNTITSARLTDVDMKIEGLPNEDFKPFDFFRKTLGIFF
jgi:Flagellar L-ring protein